jgi:hypothetical protein
MNLPTAFKVVTPECFYRGSTLLTKTLSRLSKGRGSSPNIPPGFPLKACGNDGLRKVQILRSKLRGITAAEIKISAPVS